MKGAREVLLSQSVKFSFLQHSTGVALKQQKNRNLQCVFDLFRSHGKTSQSFLSRRSGLQASTISNHMKLLRALGIVVPEGKGATTPEGGRPSEELVLNPEFMQVGVALLRAQSVEFCCVDLQGQISHRSTHPCASLAEAQAKVESLVAEVKAASAVPYHGTQWLSANAHGLASFAHGALYYHRSHGSLRSAPFLALVVEQAPFTLMAAYGDAQGALRGEHGRAGALSAGPDACEARLAWLQEQILWTARLFDPAAVGLSGSFFESDVPGWSALFSQLQTQLHPVALRSASHPDASILGGAWMLQDSILEGLLHAQSL